MFPLCLSCKCVDSRSEKCTATIRHWTYCEVSVTKSEIKWSTCSKRMMAQAWWGGTPVRRSPRRIPTTADSSGAGTPAHSCDGRHGLCPPWPEWASSNDRWYVRSASLASACQYPRLFYSKICSSEKVLGINTETSYVASYKNNCVPCRQAYVKVVFRVEELLGNI